MEKVKPSVGLGATVHGWSDSTPYTIKSLSKSGRQFTMTQDKATLDPSFKPEIIPGGFVGHCVNQDEQKYTYETQPDGHEVKVSLRKDGKWKISGTSQVVTVGLRMKFYDYNF